MKAAIIGSGFGGLAIANRLQARGIEVTIFEKNSQIGGHASQLKKDGYTFDMGPSIITIPQIIDDIFAAAGKKREDYLTLLPVDPYYRMYFKDGSTLDYVSDSTEMKKQLSAFNPSDAEGYDRFMQASAKLYDEVIVRGLGKRPFESLLDLAKFIPRALSYDAIRSSYSFASKFFQDERSRFAFSFHPLFIGGSPFSTPALLQLIPYLEKKDGVWFAEGGMYALVQAFARLFVEQGGKIECNAEVQKILVKDKQAIGVKVNNQELLFDVVVSNAHSAHTYLDLIDPIDRRLLPNWWIKAKKYSMSCVLLYLGLKKTYPEIPHHALILSQRYRELVRDIFDRKVMPDDFSMYVHLPTRTDPSMAPPGKESMYALIPVPNLLSDYDWETRTSEFSDKVLQYLEHQFGMKDLQDNIEVLETFTPLDFAKQRNNYLGACWSEQPLFTQIGSFRPHNRSSHLKRLYLVGASTHPGAGVPGVLLGAEATEYAIREDFNV